MVSIAKAIDFFNSFASYFGHKMEILKIMEELL